MINKVHLFGFIQIQKESYKNLLISISKILLIKSQITALQIN